MAMETIAQRGVFSASCKAEYLIRRISAVHTTEKLPSVEGETIFRLTHQRLLNSKKVKHMLMPIIFPLWVNLCLMIKVDTNTNLHSERRSRSNVLLCTICLIH
jgi:hypothetical protein